MDYIS
jgi:short-subunit dehydrogenase